MATVADILQFVESLAPRSMKMDWDNVGLLCGRKEKEVKKILVALDPFRNVIEEAIEIGADCIVTHHPLIFRNPLMAVNEDSETSRCVLTLIEHGIAAINAHTNYDLAPGGVNDILAQTLGLADITVIDPDLEWTFTESEIHSKSRNSPWIGRHFRGRAVMTIVGGEVRYQLS